MAIFVYTHHIMEQSVKPLVLLKVKIEGNKLFTLYKFERRTKYENGQNTNNSTSCFATLLGVCR